MEHIFFSNQAHKYISGVFNGQITGGERKLVFNIINENLCSLFVYNLYDISHSVIRGIKQARIIKNDDNLIVIKGYGLSSNGFPIDQLMAKLRIENNEIISIEYIDNEKDVSILHKKRNIINSNFFFELFNMDMDNLEDTHKILKLFKEDFELIKDFKDSVELSVCCNYLYFLTNNPKITGDTSLHILVCMTNFYFQHKVILLNKSLHEKQKMIQLLNSNGYAFLAIISVLLLNNTNKDLSIPFKDDLLTDRAKKIFWLLESYYLFIENEYNYSLKWEDVVQSNKSKFENGILKPFNISNSKEITKELFDLMYIELIYFIENQN